MARKLSITNNNIEVLFLCLFVVVVAPSTSRNDPEPNSIPESVIAPPPTIPEPVSDAEPEPNSTSADLTLGWDHGEWLLHQEDRRVALCTDLAQRLKASVAHLLAGTPRAKGYTGKLIRWMASVETERASYQIALNPRRAVEDQVRKLMDTKWQVDGNAEFNIVDHFLPHYYDPITGEPNIAFDQRHKIRVDLDALTGWRVVRAAIVDAAPNEEVRQDAEVVGERYSVIRTVRWTKLRRGIGHLREGGVKPYILRMGNRVNALIQASVLQDILLKDPHYHVNTSTDQNDIVRKRQNDANMLKGFRSTFQRERDSMVALLNDLIRHDEPIDRAMVELRDTVIGHWNWLYDQHVSLG